MNTFLFILHGCEDYCSTFHRDTVPQRYIAALVGVCEGSLIYSWCWCFIVVSVVLQWVVSVEGPLCPPTAVSDCSFILSAGMQIIPEVKMKGEQMHIIVILTKSVIGDKILVGILSPRQFWNSSSLILWTVILLPKTSCQPGFFH